MQETPYHLLPSVSRLLEHPSLVKVRGQHAHDRIVTAIRAELERCRGCLRPQSTIDVDLIAAAILRRIEKDAQPGYQPVLNATGIVLHTNLGRAPLAETAAQAAYKAAKGYLSLEMDLATGERSSRQQPIRTAITRLTGAESATVVNNCAAATVLVLRALAAGREVIVSRGQLIEIGGSFRIPEIMAASGARLREVGTTNITRLRDYELAIGPDTAALMRVHCSNYRIRGFTQSIGITDLVALGRARGLPVIDDIGSGAAFELGQFGFDSEPTLPDSIAAGADLVLASGDKLLGGPQAGIILGRKVWIDAIERDPLMRAFRCDKMTLAALEATLELYREPDAVRKTIPVLRMITTPVAELRARTEQFARTLEMPGLRVGVVDATAYVGGGSLPDQAMPTIVIALESEHWSDAIFSQRLRLGAPAVLARVQDGQVLLDLRTIPEDEESHLAAAVRRAIQP